MHVFVTVGSTRFDKLVQRALSDSVLDILRAKGYSKVVVQCGNSEFDREAFEQAGDTWIRRDEGEVEVWRFKPSLQDDYKQADLVISHAGSGTILDVLRLRKPLIVIPNETLLDNHQQELASSLADLGHLRSSTVSGLPDAIQSLEPSNFVPFPQFNGSRFREMLDEEMGFA
ncbi:N-acetylglucosaminyldiphosphodolichol N-acetylglucosaminyltransferase catalytic subunit alg13 [Steccherinum ochraceum]|uniref:UDP-N-acetylglucosamine transferase subunit ALG13 n=1 Tax=Steccherinum ochraceum TaxID=92696 RepID=A0A4R0RTH1_9APHY|nr:N-acetylglucosaminyldiphosphodolichol N-acetylglucosaminyltransferase catalytic subunit alg13 [Steccherinum ochraceum]